MSVDLEQIIGAIVVILSLLIFFRMILREGLKISSLIKCILAIGVCAAVLKDPSITSHLGQLLVSLLESILYRLIGGISNG